MVGYRTYEICSTIWLEVTAVQDGGNHAGYWLLLATKEVTVSIEHGCWLFSSTAVMLFVTRLVPVFPGREEPLEV